MASPFKYFRKHTKAFMAVAAVICMFLFVFSSGRGGRGRAAMGQRHPAATVATWNGGSLNEAQLQALVGNRRYTNAFLQRLFVQGGGQTGYDLPTSVPNFLLQSDKPEEVELQVINTEVFSSLGQDAGITVSDAMINHYLQEFGLNRVGSEDIRGLLASAGSNANARGNEAIVFTTLRKLLVAYFYQRGFEDVARTILPEQRWEDWRRVNERISVQAASLPVEKFIDQVPAPTDTQLKQLYNEYKDYDPDRLDYVGGRELPSPSPGFSVPRRVTIQYLVGNVAERTSKLLASVTDAEIADYYERNKRKEFVKTSLDAADDFGSDLPEGEEGAGATGDGAATENTEPTATTGGAEGGAPADQPGAAAPASGEPAADAPKPGDATPSPGADPSGGGEVPAASASGAGTPGASSPTPGGESTPADSAPREGDQSAIRRRSPFRFAALQTAPGDSEAAADGDKTEGGADAAAVVPADSTGQSSPTSEAATSADAAGAPSPAGGETPSAPATTVGDGTPPTATPAAEGAASAGAPADGAKEEPVEYTPLEKVRDEIRETLARDKAVVELQRQIGQALIRLQAEYHAYGRNLIMSRDAQHAAPAVPEKLKSLKWLADEFGLEAKATEPLTALELRDTPVGKAYDEQTGRVSVTEAALSTLESYEPFLAKELEGDWYLVIKTADTPKRVPPFDEVRDQVTAAWKRIEAAKLAEKKAKDLAKESETATQSFEQFFKDQGDDVVPPTAWFSWRNYAYGPGLGYPPTLSEVPELKNVGPAFMEAAFKLDGNKTVGLLNYDHSVAYVVRLSSRQYTPDELKRLFLEEINKWMGAREMLGEHYQQVRQVVDSKLATDVAGFKFDEEWEKHRRERMTEEQ